jgi:sterol desaturase/sphingolipid hydroxylase (fatty acid hydroxylase superfamily)
MSIEDPVLQDLATRIADGLARLSLGGAGRLAPIFLIATLALAFAVWWVRRPGPGFFRWAFPRDIWCHPSHWVDIKVFLFTRLLGLTASLLAVASASAIGSWLSALVSESIGQLTSTPAMTHPIAVTVLVFLIVDICIYWSHRLSHDWALLWPFHATHHSAEVMTPITVFRRHPVDDLFGRVVTGIVTGLVLGVALGISVGKVPIAMLGGLNASFYLFNLVGANLRHSHIWLSYGPVLEHVFISPAQHQVHHSCDPRHHNRNYGEVLAIWDWMFGTLYITRAPETLTFGLADAQGARLPQPHPGLVGFLVEPFRASARVLRRTLGRRGQVSDRARE